MVSEIEVDTPQGIGDIFWVYQKLSPYTESIRLNVLAVDRSPLQTRAGDFCRLLPKVKDVRFKLVSSIDYDRVAHKRYNLNDLVGLHRFEYAVNKPLEDGIRIEDIDPEFPIERRVELKLVPRQKVLKSGYVCLYVSGSKTEFIWSSQRWAKLASVIAKMYRVNKIVIIGAPYDQDRANELVNCLRGLGHDVLNLCSKLTISETTHVLRGASFFVGYQSGLNAIAENYDVPQLMIYFPFLRPMLYTWCSKESIEKRFFASTFDSDLSPVLAKIGQKIKTQ